MSTEVIATFENGVFKPETPVECVDHSRVRLTVEPIKAELTHEDRQAAWERFKQNIQQFPVHSQGERFTRDELHDRD